jgi:hypothetical protein
MQWTSKTPSVGGIYWHFQQGDLAICEIMIEDATGNALALLTGDDEVYEAAELTGLWLGPVKPPSPPRPQTSSGGTGEP